MNHPSPEEMMAHLYGENAHSPARRQAIETHLGACGDCRAQANAWRQTMTALDSWRLPTARSTAGTGSFSVAATNLFRLALPWAAAAAIFVSAGYLAGKSTGPNPAALSAAIETHVARAMDREREALAAELRTAASRSAGQEARQILSAFAEQFEERRQADAQAFYTALQQFDARHGDALSRLRQDISTVAVVADARLLDTQEQILELANVQPASLK